jgi:hypothetical protein
MRDTSTPAATDFVFKEVDGDFLLGETIEWWTEHFLIITFHSNKSPTPDSYMNYIKGVNPLIDWNDFECSSWDYQYFA